MPEDVIRLVVRSLKEDITTLQGLKYAGPCIRAQIMPVLHEVLALDLAHHTDEDFASMLAMPFLSHIRTVIFFDKRKLARKAITRYPNLFSLLSKLKDLKTVYVHIRYHYAVFTVEILRLLAKQSQIKNLSVDQFCLDARDLDEIEDFRYPGLLSMHLKSFNSFPLLQNLSIEGLSHGIYSEVDAWLPFPPPVVGTTLARSITRLELRVSSHNIEQIWALLNL